MGPDEINEYERYLHSLQRGIKGPGGHMVTPPRTYGIRSPAGIRGPLGALALVASGLAVQRAYKRNQRKLEDPTRASAVLRGLPREDFDPSQPRDRSGRFGAGAGLAAAGAAGAIAGGHSEFMRPVGPLAEAAQWGRAAEGTGRATEWARARGLIAPPEPVTLRSMGRDLQRLIENPPTDQDIRRAEQGFRAARAGIRGSVRVERALKPALRGGAIGLGIGAGVLGMRALTRKRDAPREERGHSARGVMLAGLLGGGAGAAGGGYAGARLGEAEGLYAARMRTLVGMSRPMSEMGLTPSESLDPPFTRMPYHNPQNPKLGNWPRGGTNPQFQQLGNTVLPNQAVNKKITFSPGNWNNYAPGTAAESELIRAEQKWARNALMNPQVGEATRARMLAGGRKWGTRAGLAGLGIGVTAAMLGRARRREP